MIEGFKQTEIGVIPNEWEIKPFLDLFDFKSTASYSRAEISDRGEYGYIHYGDIHTKINFHLDINKYVSGYITKNQVKSYTIVEEGDLIMADASEDISGIGKGFEVINKPQERVISGLHTFLIRAKDKDQFARKYIGYYHVNPLIKRQFDAFATGLKVYSLSKGIFKFIKIPLPPLPEQKAIAEALSDADAWIESLEQLIAKKRLIKQGAMQVLLRPPSKNSEEGWEVRRLGEMAQLITKGTTPTSVGRDFQTSGINFIKIESISKNGKIELSKVAFIDLKTYELLLRSQIQEGDILFSIAGALGRTAIVKKEILPANTNQALGIIRLNKNSLDPRYLYYFFNQSEFQQMLNTISVTGAQPNLSLLNLNQFAIHFPKSQTEQAYIADILTDMDTEIERLENQLSKARQIKQGMMQELLTGRVRLVK